LQANGKRGETLVDGGLNPHLSGAGSKIAAKFGRDDAAPSLLTGAIHSEALT
jgi:hypothetical protein